MKKIIICLLIVVVIIAAVVSVILCTKDRVKAPELSAIAEKFNNNEQIKAFSDSGYKFNAVAEENKIVISASGEGISGFAMEFTLEKNILSGAFDLNEDNSIFGISMAAYLVTSIEELNGHESGAFDMSLSDERILDYTLEKEGLVYNLDENYHLEVKVDLTKKVPALDFSDVYVKVEDLEDLTDYIREGSAQTSAGYVVLKSFTYENTSEVVIAQKDELTKCAYNSLKSYVQVLFDSEKAAKYLTDNYNSIDVGNKEFDGVKIETNIVLDESEKDFLPDESYKIMKVTIDMAKVKEIIEK